MAGPIGNSPSEKYVESEPSSNAGESSNSASAETSKRPDSRLMLFPSLRSQGDGQPPTSAPVIKKSVNMENKLQGSEKKLKELKEDIAKASREFEPIEGELKKAIQDFKKTQDEMRELEEEYLNADPNDVRFARAFNDLSIVLKGMEENKIVLATKLARANATHTNAKRAVQVYQDEHAKLIKIANQNKERQPSQSLIQASAKIAYQSLIERLSPDDIANIRKEIKGSFTMLEKQREEFFFTLETKEDLLRIFELKESLIKSPKDVLETKAIISTKWLESDQLTTPGIYRYIVVPYSPPANVLAEGSSENGITLIRTSSDWNPNVSSAIIDKLSLPFYSLPFVKGSTTKIELGDKAQHFWTSPLGGCTIVLDKRRQNPVVCHIAALENNVSGGRYMGREGLREKIKKAIGAGEDGQEWSEDNTENVYILAQYDKGLEEKDNPPVNHQNFQCYIANEGINFFGYLGKSESDHDAVSLNDSVSVNLSETDSQSEKQFKSEWKFRVQIVDIEEVKVVKDGDFEFPPPEKRKNFRVTENRDAGSGAMSTQANFERVTPKR